MSENETNMEYTILVEDEHLALTIVEGYTNSTGMNALLKRFTPMPQSGRRDFMNDLLWQGSAEYKAKQDAALPYSIYATGVVSTMVRGAKE